MSKASKERSGHTRDEEPFIPPRYQHLAAIGFLLLTLVIYFREPIFNGKVFIGADNIASHSFDTLLEDARREGIFPLWNPYIFCGMPGYGSLTLSGDRTFDLSSTIFQLFSRLGNVVFMNPTVGWAILYYAIFACGVYLLAWHLLRNKPAALIVSLAAVYSTFIIIWIMFGHNTKIGVIALFPYILYALERLRDRIILPLGLILILLLHLSYVPSHIQMIFYTYLAYGGYLLFFLLRGIVKKTDWKPVLKTAGVLVVASMIAFAMDADKYLSVLEYNPSSIRGASPVVQSSADAGSKTKEGGLDYEYATNWSLGVGEVLTWFVPSLYGFGSHLYQGPLTGNQPVRINTYFGPQHFTDAPQYMGVVITILAFIGFWRNRREPFVQYIAIMVVFSLLVAFGRELPVVYDLMFKFMPGFNKFRVPSMILTLVQIMMPLLAGYGIISFLSQRGQPLTPVQEKRWKVVLGGIGGLLALSLVAGSVVTGIYESFFPSTTIAARYQGATPQVISGLYSIVEELVLADVRYGLAFLLLAFSALYMYIRQSIRLNTLIAVLVVVVIVDLWRVNTKPMETHDPQVQKNMFTAPEYVRVLQQDTTLFRVLEFEHGQPPLNNMLAYWRIQSAFGYQGAKMRRYQDLVDVVGLGNPLLWQLMNVKYIITDQPDSSRWLGLVYNGTDRKVYVNQAMLPRAFFVNRYEVADGMDVLSRISKLEFDARDVAYLAEDPGVKIDPPHQASLATFVRYGIQDFSMRLETGGTNLLCLSESYYPVGWKAFLDGTEIPIYRANYHFRAVVIPPGKHSLEMRFEPRGFAIGKTLSLATNVLVLGCLSFVGFQTWKKRKKAT